MKKIRKAVIPAAGFGTRMLPITKSISKEILPLVDKPIIQIVVEELVEAGIEDIIIVTAAHKTDLANYFGDTDPGLVAHLLASDKQELVRSLEAVKGLASFAFIEQTGVYGTGTPVLNAAPYLGGEPFVYTFADDFFVAQHTNSFAQLMQVYEQYGAPVIACQPRTAEQDYARYGYVGGAELEANVVDVTKIAEQPAKHGLPIPGNLASLGGFIVTADVIGYLQQVRDNLQPAKELYFNAAFELMIADGKRVMACEITDADYYDTGNKLEYMKTAVAMAARHPEIGADFQQFLNEFVTKEK